MKTIQVFCLPNGREPFEDWARSQPAHIRASVDAYIDRIANGGGRKNVRSLGEGVFEIKVNRGPGYRVYFGQDSADTIILLLGGDKGSQSRDITKAKEYWRMDAQNR